MQFKSSAMALALSAIAFSASAMTLIEDADLSQVTGQDGVTIAGDLHINIGAFKWTDTDLDGGSISFNNIQITGMIINTIDVLSQSAFGSVVAASLSSYDPANTAANVAAFIASGFAPPGDVIQIAIPNANVSHAIAPTIAIGSITNGNSTKSYGSLEIKNLDMQGTKMWIWAH